MSNKQRLKMTPKGRRIVFDNEVDRYGVYLWEMPNGSFIADDEGNFLSIAAEVNNPVRIERLRRAAAELGIVEGRAVFFPGHRKINDEEYERQKSRHAAGLIPDEYDVSAYKDEAKQRLIKA